MPVTVFTIVVLYPLIGDIMAEKTLQTTTVTHGNVKLQLKTCLNDGRLQVKLYANSWWLLTITGEGVVVAYNSNDAIPEILDSLHVFHKNSIDYEEEEEEEVEEEEKPHTPAMVAARYAKGDVTRITCYNCVDAVGGKCKHAWDAYNTDGYCLAEK